MMYNGKTRLTDEEAAIMLAAIMIENKNDIRVSEEAVAKATQTVSAIWAKGVKKGKKVDFTHVVLGLDRV